MLAADPVSGLTRVEQTHPFITNGAQRVMYIAQLMARDVWRRGESDEELAAAWKLEASTIRNYATEASRHLKLLGQKEHVLGLVRAGASNRLDGSADKDFVQLARLLLETVGGLEQKQVIRHELVQYSDEQLFIMTLDEIRKDPEKRQRAIAYLSAEAIETEGEGIE